MQVCGVYFLALFALLPDLDKLMGMPGLFHSILILGPLLLFFFLIERKLNGTKKYSTIIAFFVLSHLILDFLGDGIVTLFYPVMRTGVGLRYPLEIAFGEGVLEVTVRGSIEIVKTAPEPGFHSYEGLVTGYGVALSFAFLTIFFNDRLKGKEKEIH